jgi:FkbM family methyltransferase
MGLLNRIRFFAEKKLGKRSYAQEGEDMVLYDFFVGSPSGFYVDVGAHNPRRLSNTYFFYRKGWSGINIDPVPGMKKRFDKVRPRDINIEMGVAQQPSVLKYYEFNEPALNSFDKDLSAERNGLNGYHIVNTREVEVAPLADILGRFLPPNQRIDFLTVDAEGYDFEVISSNDWKRFRPKVAVVELRKEKYTEIMDDSIFRFLTSQNYELFAWTGRSCFFRSNS